MSRVCDINLHSFQHTFVEYILIFNFTLPFVMIPKMLILYFSVIRNE
jgi:hypothetical protein